MEIGDVLAGKYRIERVLGRGGMGIVVQAMHLQLAQPVAVKFLLPEVLHNEQVVQRFLREAQAAVRLKSEHVARVIDVGQFDTGAPYMVLEYLDGLDLAHFPRAQLTVGLVVDFMLQACEALAEAHALGIVHRDIKPANFFATRGPDGAYLVKILDFGISKAPTGQADRNLTATMMVMGTPAYMSPEQMRASKSVDNRSDIWSLGIVLYELLQGVPPFEADTFSSMIIKVATEQLPPMTVRLPAGLDAIIYRCLEKDATRRYQNVAELAAAIAPYAGSSVQAALTVDRTSRVYGTYPPRSSPPTTLTSSSGAVTQPPGGKRRWPLFAGIGTVVVGGIVIAAVAAGGGGDGSGVVDLVERAVEPTGCTALALGNDTWLDDTWLDDSWVDDIWIDDTWVDDGGINHDRWLDDRWLDDIWLADRWLADNIGGINDIAWLESIRRIDDDIRIDDRWLDDRWLDDRWLDDNIGGINDIAWLESIRRIDDDIGDGDNRGGDIDDTRGGAAGQETRHEGHGPSHAADHAGQAADHAGQAADHPDTTGRETRSGQRIRRYPGHAQLTGGAMRIASVLVMGLIWASPAQAQPADTTTMAEQLFNQGRDAAAKNDWATACPKFEASLRYDPALGTRLNLANCYEKLGKIAKAWGMYRDAADKASTLGDTKRKEYALEQAAKLEPRLPKLTIVAPAKPPTGFTVTRDGSPVDATMFGGGFYVDPGAHELVASAPGYASITKSVRVDEGKSETVTIPDLEAKPEAPQESKPGGRPQVDDNAVRVAPPPPSKTWKYVGLGTAAGGVVMLGVGIAFGAKASSTYSDAKSVCSNLVCQNTDDFAKGQKLISDARSQATLATVFVVGGAAFAAGGVAVWLFAPTGGSEKGMDARLVPHASPSDVGVSLVGRF